ncbi:MAG: ROK family protein [Candidatus Sumerlaeia bacterium]
MTDQVFMGVDMGGTNTKLAIADREGKVVLERRMPTASQDGPEKVLARIADKVNEMVQETGTNPESLGMAIPGTLDLINGISKFLPNFPGHWPEVPVRDILSEKTGMPVYIMNDVRTATLGEYDFGAGKDGSVNTMILMAIGTGLGGGVVVDGELRLGPIGSAGELGHMIIIPGGRACGCGARGCLETLVSGPALAAEGVRLLLSGQAMELHKIVGGDPGKVEAKTMGEAARAGDEAVKAVIERVGEYLGIGIANLIVALHPDLFVIGGGVMGLGDLLLNPVRRSVNEHVKMFPTDDIRIEAPVLGDSAGVLGAVAVAIHKGLLEQVE